MKINNLDSSASSLSYKVITNEVVEKKLFSKFPYLNEPQQLHKLFFSYDFRENEEYMVRTWYNILTFLFQDIFSTFGMKISEIKLYTIINNNIPTGLSNIIQELRIRLKLITNEDISNQEFYNRYFPDLYSNTSQSWGSYFMSGIKNLVNFTGNNFGCKEDKTYENELNRRTDISDEDKYKELSDNTIVFNYDLLKNNCKELLDFLSEILHENNDNDIISKNEFIKEVDKVSHDNGGIYNEINLQFGTIYIDYCLIYLFKLKKISIFTIEENNKKIEFIKLLLNKHDEVKEKDKVIAKLLIKSDLLQIKIQELDKKIESCLNSVKNFIKKGDKKSAKPLMIKKKNYEKYKQLYENTQTTIIQQMMDIKEAENNVQFVEILNNCNNLFKTIGVDKDEFAEMTEDLREQKDIQNEISNGLKDFANENEDEINDEIKNIENEENNNVQLEGSNLQFPNAEIQPINPFSSEEQELYKQ